ncbi:MAG TPA: hypothetical protein VKL99_01790 [Candidatus Angelobacter sp.]|nr:hypothetical protein [Candidatus Angelobacter sp.]
MTKDERRLHTDTTELVNHLKELTNALNAVHGDLYWLAMQSPDASKKEAVPAAELNVDLLAELKGAVDDMRLLLWQYIETASELDPQNMREGLETQRLRRVTRFLQLLRERLGHAVEEQPVSFIERISARVKESLGDKAA